MLSSGVALITSRTCSQPHHAQNASAGTTIQAIDLFHPLTAAAALPPLLEPRCQSLPLRVGRSGPTLSHRSVPQIACRILDALNSRLA